MIVAGLLAWSLGLLAATPARAGLTSPAEIRGGSSASEWQPTSSVRTITFTLSPAATASSTIECWAYLPAPAPEGLTLKVGTLRSSARIPLGWSGWRRLVVPVSALTWDTSVSSSNTRLILRAEGSIPAGFRIHLTPPRLYTLSPDAVPKGPGITKEDLLDRLDLSLPALASVRDQVRIAENKVGQERQEAIDAALTALVAHFRALPSNAYIPSSLDSPDADTVSQGTYTFEGVTHTFSPFLLGVPGRIQWDYNPTLQPNDGEADTYEWGYSLHRHASWYALARAYRAVSATDAVRASKFAAYWANNLDSWSEQCPAPAVADETNRSAWRGIEAGLRMRREWPGTFFTFAKAPASVVSDEVLLTFLRLAVDHGEFLDGRAYSPGNHYLLGQCGLYNLGAAFPELAASAGWKTRSTARLLSALDRNTLPDGGIYEGSPDYHNWVISSVAEVLNRAQAAGRGGDVPLTLWSKLRFMAEWNAALAAPDQRIPALNDGNPVPASATAFANWEIGGPSPLLSWAKALPRNPNAVPDTQLRSLFLPNSGYAVLRTGWTRDDSYVLMDVGPLGGWHGHQDALNLIVYFYGRGFLFDNGGSSYKADIWRDYGLSSASHNTVLVDNLSQAREFSASDPVGYNPPDTPVPRFGTSDTVDYVSGWYVGNYGSTANRPATHRREIAFLKPVGASPPALLAVDTLTSRDGLAHVYDLRWHLNSTSYGTTNVGPGKVVWTKDAGKPNLAVVSLAGASRSFEKSAIEGGNPETTFGWFYPRREDPPVSALTLQQLSASTAAELRFVNLLVPFLADPATCPVTSITGSGASGAWTITLVGGASFTVSMHPSSDASPSFSIANRPLPAPLTTGYAGISIARAAYDAWRATQSPHAPDTTTSFSRYAFGTTPVRPAIDHPTARLGITFLRRTSGVLYEIQESTDLLTWQTLPPTTLAPPSLASEYDTVTYFSSRAAPRFFLRVRATLP